jgi:hypothetical protein
MVWWHSWEQRDVPSRWVQCPECGKIVFSGKKFLQCTRDECRFRMIGDNHPFKTIDDTYKERQEIDQILQKMESRLEKEIQTIGGIRMKLKPLFKPKIKESKSTASESTEKNITPSSMPA